MRTLFFLLLLANLTLFGYTQLDSIGNGEGIRLTQQVQPEKIRILTPAQVAALDKVASLAPVCVEWGPFTEAERARAMTEIEPLGLSRLVSQKRIDAGPGWWVYVGDYTTRATAERRATELRASGLADVSVVDNGSQRFAVSLGVFRSEGAANAHAASLPERGISNARVAPREQTLALGSIVVRDPPASAVARLRELGASHPNAEVKVGPCGS